LVFLAAFLVATSSPAPKDSAAEATSIVVSSPGCVTLQCIEDKAGLGTYQQQMMANGKPVLKNNHPTYRRVAIDWGEPRLGSPTKSEDPVFEIYVGDDGKWCIWKTVWYEEGAWEHLHCALTSETPALPPVYGWSSLCGGNDYGLGIKSSDDDEEEDEEGFEEGEVEITGEWCDDTSFTVVPESKDEFLVLLKREILYLKFLQQLSGKQMGIDEYQSV